MSKFKIFNNVNNDLIFMQIDVDCDVINKYKCKNI